MRATAIASIAERLSRPASLLALSALGQLTIGFANEEGGGLDLENFARTGAAFVADPLHVYGVNEHGVISPYFPGFTPWLGAAHLLAEGTGLPFHGLLHLPLVAAVLGIAWLVRSALLESGRGEGEARLGLAAVAFGPLFVQVSAWHGQIEAAAFLPALAGVLVWRRGGPRRWLWAGLLLGAGAAVKSVPVLLVLALAPTARGAREWVAASAVAVAVPLSLLLPFALAEPDGVRAIFEYRGVPGAGGLALLVQPSLAEPWVRGLPLESVPLQDAALHLQELATPILLLVLLGTAGAALLRRIGPLEASAAILLATNASSVNLFGYYLLWAVPFLLASGRLWPALALQAAGVGWQAIIILGARVPELAGPAVPAFVALMAVVTAGSAGGALLLLRRRPSTPSSTVRGATSPRG